MPRLAAHGISVAAPPGWDVRIYRRPAQPGETTHAVLHAGNFALPDRRGDYGSGAVEMMGQSHALVVLLEFHPGDAGSPLFSGRRMPQTLDPASFSPTTLQRGLPGQAGTQAFFAEQDRAFCLYVVLGSYARRARLVADVNRLLPAIAIASIERGLR